MDRPNEGNRPTHPQPSGPLPHWVQQHRDGHTAGHIGPPPALPRALPVPAAASRVPRALWFALVGGGALTLVLVAGLLGILKKDQDRLARVEAELAAQSASGTAEFSRDAPVSASDAIGRGNAEVARGPKVVSDQDTLPPKESPDRKEPEHDAAPICGCPTTRTRIAIAFRFKRRRAAVRFD